MGATHNSLRSDKRHSFSISHCTSPARLPCGPSNGSLRIALNERNCFAVFSNQFNNSPKLVMPPCCASSAMRSEQFCLFRLCIAGDVLLRSEKEGRLSERSELCVPPDCDDTASGTPKGRCIAVAFFCLLFLGETRKVSGCRAAPGNALSSEENKHQTTTATTQKRAKSTSKNQLKQSSNLLQLGNAQIQQLHPELTEIDMRPRTHTATFNVDDDPLTELGMCHILPNTPARIRPTEILRNLVIARFRRLIPSRLRTGKPTGLLLNFR